MKLDDDIKQVGDLLAAELNTDNGVVLAAQLAAIEAWGARVAYLRYESKLTLDRKLAQALLPKSKDYTDLDRTTNQASAVAEYQATSDYLEQVQELVKRRISLGQTLLRGMQTEMNTRVNLV